MRLTQSYYTLAFEPTGPFFQESVTNADLNRYAGEGNPLVYVSSVTYGRIFYLLVESTAEEDSVDASLSASFIFGGFSGRVRHVSHLADLNIKAFALGGRQESLIEGVRGGVSGLDNFLSGT